MKNTFTSTRFGNNAVHVSLLLLRLGLGIMMLNHGLPKMMNYTNMAPGFFDPWQISSHFMLALVVFAEVFCSLFLILGLFTRWATIPLIVQMIIVIFMVHVDDGFGKQELGAHFLLGYIVLWLLGPGKMSLDQLINRR